ncbi:MAG TPA: ADP-forming succinate--CoA ligase subunit beta [Candidatus Kapabacteria bacterium]|nr:ADP-forming succinate--CoA ligase subunit beta [Candidatus Kapabacteria bacterium]
MKIHEYQAKELLSKFGIPTLKHSVVFTAEDAGKLTYDEFQSKGIQIIALKAQVYAGGRGKGIVYDVQTNQPINYNGKEVRGVNIISGNDIAHSAYEYATRMLGNKLVTVQTGAAGSIIHRLLIEEGCSISREFYLSITLDRQTGRNVVMASTEGGVEIEQVAAESPEKILRETIDPRFGLMQYQVRRIALGLNLKGDAYKNFIIFLPKLAKAYDELDASLLEINPLVQTSDNNIIALDAKINFDDNALYRHPDYLELRDFNEESPLEVEASKYDLNYIKLDGNVGCMVNGAGLAMATMDLIKYAGGKPANFLDVGGGANVDRIANAFKIMMSDPDVKAVLINIFGGIVRCDKVADGIVQALKDTKVDVPIIVRLEGTNSVEAKLILKNSGLSFKVANSFLDAAQKVTEVVKNVE